ncbi:MAG: hypothetical protein VX747_06330, partial [Actinomycetota bacterium]|nr:hypothetical protein [Actinomycetota bacterium]
DAEGPAAAAAEAGEAAMQDGAEEEPAEILKDHIGLDVPLDEVVETKQAAERYQKNAHKFDERGFRIMRKEKAAFSAGFDMTSEEEKKKREARAAKWGTAPEEPSAEEAEEAARALAERQKRAERFGVPLNDVVEKQEALKKTDLETILSMMDKRRKSLLKLDEQDQRVDPSPEVEVRPDALHLYGYMPLGTDDFMDAYRPFGATTVEWINGVALNVVFVDKFAAARAMEATSSPLPEPLEEDEAAAAEAGAAEAGEDGAAVAMSEETPDLAMFGWRLSQDIVKKKSDKYGKAGEVGKLLVRYATVDDLKTYKPRPEGQSAPRERRRSKKKRRSRSDDMEMEGGQKVHDLVIREPAAGRGSGKRRRR